MKLVTIAAWMALLPCLAAGPVRQEGPSEEHRWLQQLVGSWKTEIGGPNGDPDGATRTVVETTRSIGHYWVVSESTVPFPGGAVHYLRTLGFDPEEGVFVGTWVDSSSSHLWTYRGRLDAAGETLALESHGPGPDGEPTRYRDEIELQGPDRRVHRNLVVNEDGAWNLLGEAVFERRR